MIAAIKQSTPSFRSVKLGFLWIFIFQPIQFHELIEIDITYLSLSVLHYVMYIIIIMLTYRNTFCEIVCRCLKLSMRLIFKLRFSSSSSSTILACSELFRCDLISYHLKFWESADDLEASRANDRRATLVLDRIHGTGGLVSHINVG